MASAGTRPTAKTYADICLQDISSRTGFFEVKAALTEAKSRCAGQTGTAYGRCMDATYPRMVIKHAQSRLQACGEKIDIKGGCTSPGCAPAMRADIAAYLRGEDPVAARAAAAALSAKNATTPEDAAKAAEDVAKAAADAAAAAESGLTLPTTTEEGTTTTTEATAGPGVPLWVWLAGGAAAVLFLTRSSK